MTTDMITNMTTDTFSDTVSVITPDFIKTMDIQPGLTAVIGSGGKTTLLRKASECLSGTVLLATSTHIFPFDGIPLYTGNDTSALQELLARDRVVCIGSPTQNGKLTKPAISFERLAALADYVLVEADGSKHMPLKAHASYEPVVPENANRVIWLIGSAGFGHPVREVVHRPEIFCGMMQVSPDTIVTEELYMEFVQQEQLHNKELRSQLAGKKVDIYIV